MSLIDGTTVAKYIREFEIQNDINPSRIILTSDFIDNITEQLSAYFKESIYSKNEILYKPFTLGEINNILQITDYEIH